MFALTQFNLHICVLFPFFVCLFNETTVTKTKETESHRIWECIIPIKVTQTCGGIKTAFTDHNQFSNSVRVSTLDIKLLGKTLLLLVILQPIFV